MRPRALNGTDRYLVSGLLPQVVDCQWACPAHTNVPEYIRLIAQGRYTDAYMLNRESNVFPGILGRTCDRPCEPACRRGRVDGKPVAICRLKRVAADLRGDITDRLPKIPTQQERQAHRLHRRGARLAHRRQRPDAARLRGHDLREVRQARRPDAHQHPRVPPARKRCSRKRSAMILDMGVDIRYNSPVDSMRALLDEGFDAVFVGTRRARGKELDLPGRHDDASRHPHRHRLAGVGRLRPHRLDRRARADHRRRQHRHGLLPHVAPPGRQGHQGDGAPAARILQGFALGAGGRRGRGRRDRHQPRAQALRDRERQAHRHGVRAPGVGSRTATSQSTRHRHGLSFPCDDVILAIGQENAFPWIERDLGIEFDKWDMPVVDETTMQSTLPGRLLRRRRRVGTEEHHLGRRARPPGRDLHPQLLPGRAGHRAPAARA